MFGFIKKTFVFLSLLAHGNSVPLLRRVADTTTPTTTYTSTSSSTGLPMVVLHGLESSTREMEPLCDWLETTFDINVFNIEIGNGKKTSLYSSLNYQLAELCLSIYEIAELSGGFDFLGISQGGLLARGYVERCNSYPVRNLITLVAPHGGVYWKNAKNNGLMYNDFFQNFLSIASYWRNPTMLASYLSSCSYLPSLNNELWCETDSPTHRRNIRNLSNFVMIWSPEDTVLNPPESGKFSFFDADFNVIPLEDTKLYKTDALGLKYLNYIGRLHIYETNCTHVDHRNSVCFAQLYPILKNFLQCRKSI
jgi:palmitoyl-protein thioesterase